MKTAFFAGSFDPFTVGHLQVVKQASEIFDFLLIGMGVNPYKPDRRYDRFLMKETIEKILKREHLDNVKVITFDGYTVDAAKKYNTDVLVRSFRSHSEHDDEEKNAEINERIGNLKTIYVRSGNYGAISSSYVMTVFNYGADISDLVPPEVLKVMLEKKSQNKC